MREFVDVAKLLAPRSVAVVGASDKPGNLGGDTVRRLVKFGFPGPVWPVNRGAEAVSGRPGFARVADLPAPAELAVFAIPAAGLPDAVRECAAAGIRHGIAYAGGLGEAGDAGAALQARLVAQCREAGFVLCGPNCVGIINTAVPVTATFATALLEIDALRQGVVSMVSQSGGIGTTAFAIAQQAGFGFRHLVSSGNEAMVAFADYLHAFACDDGTHVIAGYLEGLSDGPPFVAALAEARRRGKKVVLIKAGTTPASARAALAHTGALAGEERVFDAILQEFGVIRAYSIEELVDLSLMLAGIPPHKLPKGPGVGIVTFGGGNGVLAADQCAQAGLATPALDAGGVARLKPLLVSVASAANPLDLTPTTAMRAELLAQLPDAALLVAGQAGIDVLMFIVGSLGSRGREIADVIRDIWTRADKPMCVSWPSPPAGVVERLAEHGIYTFLDYGRGVRAIGRLVRHAATPPASRALGPIEPLAFDWSAFVAARDGLVVPEHRCHAILQAAGLPVAAGEVVHDEAGALVAAATVGFPVALKGLSEQVTHRAAAGLLAIDLRSADEVREAWRRLDARAHALGLALDGIYVQRMHKGGAELLVSAFRDPLFGTMISCGAGGVLTELIDDVVIARAPVDARGAAALLDRLRVRRHAAKALDAGPAAAFIARFSALAAGAPWQHFVLEVNPIKWSADGVVAVDGLLIVEQA